MKKLFAATGLQTVMKQRWFVNFVLVTKRGSWFTCEVWCDKIGAEFSKFREVATEQAGV